VRLSSFITQDETSGKASYLLGKPHRLPRTTNEERELHRPATPQSWHSALQSPSTVAQQELHSPATPRSFRLSPDPMAIQSWSTTPEQELHRLATPLSVQSSPTPSIRPCAHTVSTHEICPPTLEAMPTMSPSYSSDTTFTPTKADQKRMRSEFDAHENTGGGTIEAKRPRRRIRQYSD
jgi:hypothetical protein